MRAYRFGGSGCCRGGEIRQAVGQAVSRLYKRVVRRKDPYFFEFCGHLALGAWDLVGILPRKLCKMLRYKTLTNIIGACLHASAILGLRSSR